MTSKWFDEDGHKISDEQVREELLKAAEEGQEEAIIRKILESMDE